MCHVPLGQAQAQAQPAAYWAACVCANANARMLHENEDHRRWNLRYNTRKPFQCAMCIVHCALCIVHCALCIVHANGKLECRMRMCVVVIIIIKHETRN